MGLSLVLATTVVGVFRTLLLWRRELLLLLLLPLLTFHISSLILYILRLGLRYDDYAIIIISHELMAVTTTDHHVPVLLYSRSVRSSL